MSWKISLEQVQELLRSPELESVQSRIAGAKEKIIPAPGAMRLWAELSLAGMNVQDFQRILKSDADELIAFGRKLQALDCADDEEYAEGEEPGPDERARTIRVLGFENGFALSYACLFNFLKNNDDAGLWNFLRKRRIPGLKKFQNQLRTIYQEIKE